MEQNMRKYDYFLYEGEDSYGQPQLSEEVKGQIKMAIYETSTSVQGNINYKNAQYVGLTNDTSVSDKYVIEYDGSERLKVLYINPRGRYKQVFLGAM